MPVSAVLDLSTLTPTDGVEITGAAPADQLTFGNRVGDVNGDGFDDYLFSTKIDALGEVAAYIVFGTAAGLPVGIDLATLNGSNGFRFTAGDSAMIANGVGYTGTNAGDVNGDGIDDLIISDGDGRFSGVYTNVYVLFGKTEPFDAVVDANDMGPEDGFAMSSSRPIRQANIIDDLNGDGLADMILVRDEDDIIYVVYGRQGDGADLDLDALDPAEGFAITYANEPLFDVAVGDFNGDGRPDIAVGTLQSDDGNTLPAGAGEVYLLLGDEDGFESTDLAALPPGEGIRIAGEVVGGGVGMGVAFTDINGDGLDDLVASAFTPNSSGEVYVVFGATSGVDTDLRPSELNGANGFRIVGSAPNTALGLGLSGGGDFNGDGYQDLIVSARGAAFNGAQSGAAYVLFGRAEGFAATIDLSTLDGSNGFRIDGAEEGDLFGLAPRFIGDANGDGFDDLMVVAPRTGNNASRIASVYIIYGEASFKNFAGTADADVFEGGTLGDTLNGLGSSDTLSGAGGDDIIDGGDGADRLFGDEGADDILGGAGGDLLDGGTGADQMAGGLGDDTYVVDDFADQVTEGLNQGQDRVRSSVDFILGANVENLQLTGSGDNNGTGNGLANQIDGNGGSNFIRGGGGNDILKAGAGNDFLFGEEGDDLILGGDGIDAINGSDGNDRIEGGAGADDILGGLGLDLIDGGDGDDILRGNGGNDQINGGAGADDLVGNSGNDVLNGGDGADQMAGGTEDDIYVVTLGDTVLENSGEGIDTVRAGLSWTLGAQLERLVLEGTGDFAGTGNGLANQITGNGGANILDGAAGNDIISGGLGADQLIGGTGNDILTGGGGIDTFVVRQESVYSSLAPQGRVLEVDTIADYQIGVDIIDLSAIVSGDADGVFNLVSNFDGVAGRMTLKFAGGTTTLSLDVDGDSKADYLLKINGDVTGESGRWLL